MNRLRCILSGGHKYHPSRIVTIREPRSRTITLYNFCAKCGKMISFDIPEKFIYMEIKKFKEKEWFRWSENHR
jgi:hypothetical protein